MNLLLASLQEIPLEARAAELERQARVFPERVPYGGWALRRACTAEDVEKELLEDEAFFPAIRELLDAPSPLIDSLQARFERNAAHMRKLMLTTSDEWQALPMHERFPLYGRFNELLHETAPARARITLDDLTFTTAMIGRGGMADVYKAHHRDGTPYALKLFNKSRMLSGMERAYGVHHEVVRQVMDNVREHFELLGSAPFARPVFVPCHAFDLDWYVLEYADGRTMSSLLNSGEVPASGAGRAMLTYASMLSLLHRNHACFVDNNWGAVMVEDEAVRIVDYDAVSSVERLSSRAHLKLGTTVYGSREHRVRELRLSPLSDLESFALMIDHLLVGAPLIDIGAEGEYAKHIAARDAAADCAQSNHRTYPKARYSCLPASLRQVVAPLIEYPRDESLTAEDFIAAIKADYCL